MQLIEGVKDTDALWTHCRSYSDSVTQAISPRILLRASGDGRLENPISQAEIHRVGQKLIQEIQIINATVHVSK